MVNKTLTWERSHQSILQFLTIAIKHYYERVLYAQIEGVIKYNSVTVTDLSLQGSVNVFDTVPWLE